MSKINQKFEEEWRWGWGGGGGGGWGGVGAGGGGECYQFKLFELIKVD